MYEWPVGVLYVCVCVHARVIYIVHTVILINWQHNLCTFQCKPTPQLTCTKAINEIVWQIIMSLIWNIPEYVPLELQTYGNISVLQGFKVFS